MFAGDVTRARALFQDQEIVDEDEAIALSIDAGRVQFKDVCFHYDPAKQILKNISFTVQPGETYALVSGFVCCEPQETCGYVVCACVAVMSFVRALLLRRLCSVIILCLCRQNFSGMCCR